MWTARLRVDSPHVAALAASLSTEQKTFVDGRILEMNLCESRAKDLRAIWNTRMRSLLIAESVIQVMDSSTPKE
ncbi:MAG TPA: hypothetical protein EYQ73_01920 [Candidatus Poseidoniales archaeon]|jgi:hypothetical protein|nr:hypothetical protein [Candidatus Poseidoniales archaeon]HIL66193.1 hypothetical protein [Candidatus Poseidoniales archaeon]